jgi:hypothetical protein
MNDCLEAFYPQLDSRLVTADALSSIDALARSLPPFLASFLECRLGANEPQVDFSARLSAGSLQGVSAEQGWKINVDAYQEWLTQNPFLPKEFGHVALEFDIPEGASPVPVPAFFLSLHSDASNSDTLIRMSSRVLGRRLPLSFESYIAHCVDSLPSPSYVGYLGLMLSRAQESVRLISRIATDRIVEYLRKIGWVGTQEPLERLLAELTTLTDFICLSFDAGDRIMPRLGFECYLTKQPKHEPRWSLLLERLNEMNLCSGAKKDALLSWPGYTRERTEESPANSSEQSSWKNPFLNSVASIRKISHLKILYDSHARLEAKAYLEMVTYA